MLAHGGIPTEDSYGPYLGQDGYCRADKATVGLKIKVTSAVNGNQKMFPKKHHIKFILTCPDQHHVNSVVQVDAQGWVNVTSGSTEALKVAIASRGPVSVAIDAGHKSLSFYSHGWLNN